MIKFFRKIRQNLLSENKFSKYLLYAIGEIFLLLIGVLLAIQVNNWNLLRIENEKFNEDLVYVLDNLQDDLTQLIALKENRINGLGYANRFIDSYLKHQPITLDTFFRGIGKITFEKRFIRKTSGLKRIESSQRYQSREFFEIREQLEAYAQLVDLFTYDEDRLNVYIEEHELVLTKNGQFTELYEVEYKINNDGFNVNRNEDQMRWTDWIENSQSFKAILVRYSDDTKSLLIPQYQRAVSHLEELINDINQYSNLK